MLLYTGHQKKGPRGRQKYKISYQLFRLGFQNVRHYIALKQEPKAMRNEDTNMMMLLSRQVGKVSYWGLDLCREKYSTGQEPETEKQIFSV